MSVKLAGSGRMLDGMPGHALYLLLIRATSMTYRKARAIKLGQEDRCLTYDARQEKGEQLSFVPNFRPTPNFFLFRQASTAGGKR